MDHTAYKICVPMMITNNHKLREKGELWRNTSISNLKKDRCYTWSLTPFSGSLVMEHIAGSSRWAISLRVKKFWVAAMPRTPACLAGGKGSFRARRNAEDIIFCLTYNRITIKEWKSFLFLITCITVHIFITWRGDNLHWLYALLFALHSNWRQECCLLIKYMYTCELSKAYFIYHILKNIKFYNIPFYWKFKANQLAYLRVKMTGYLPQTYSCVCPYSTLQS